MMNELITQTLHYSLLLFTKHMVHIFLQSLYQSFILFFNLEDLVLLFYIFKLYVFLYKLIENSQVVPN